MRFLSINHIALIFSDHFKSGHGAKQMLDKIGQGC